jgi:hypothetical protein
MPSHRFFRAYPLLPLALVTLTATAGDIQFSLEEPFNGSIYSGVTNIRGWAVSSAGIRNVELLVDGVSNGNIPSGGRRVDVGNAYPTYPNSSQSGFSMIFNYSNLTVGAHTFSVNVIDNQGSQKSATASFNVARFNNSFIDNPAAISLNAATITDDNDKSILINNLQADGQLYNVRLEWRREVQGFALTSINPVGGGSGSGSARWSALNNVGCANGSFTYEVTIDGTTKRSTTTCGSVISPSTCNTTFEGFASTTPGAKNWVAKAVSSTCGLNSQVSGTATLASDACYRFTLNPQGQNLVNSFGTVNCPSSANANTLQAEPEATPMAIFPMQPVDPSGVGQERWDLIKKIGQP